MASLMDVLRGKRTAAAPPPAWAQALFAAPLTPLVVAADRQVQVWAVADKTSKATITDQFKAGAGEYHRRYAASDHFEALFRQAIDATGIAIAERPTILDLGSGSGVNSAVPCRRLFPGARMVATDLSGELLAMLAAYAADGQGNGGDDLVCVKMDAMSPKVAPGSLRPGDRGFDPAPPGKSAGGIGRCSPRPETGRSRDLLRTLQRLGHRAAGVRADPR